jgi:hypothetical protein
MLLRPRDGLFGQSIGPNRNDGGMIGQHSQGCLLFRRHLAVPKGLQPGQSQVPDFPVAFLVGDMLPDGGNVAVRLFRLARQQFAGLPVNLPVALGEQVAQFLRDAFDLKIAARVILNLVAELPQ